LAHSVSILMRESVLSIFLTWTIIKLPIGALAEDTRQAASLSLKCLARQGCHRRARLCAASWQPLVCGHVCWRAVRPARAPSTLSEVQRRCSCRSPLWGCPRRASSTGNADARLMAAHDAVATAATVTDGGGWPDKTQGSRALRDVRPEACLNTDGRPNGGWPTERHLREHYH